MKVFLTGASGLLGSNVLIHCQNDYQITANYRSRIIKANHKNISVSSINLTDIEQLDSYFSENKFDLIINAAGYTDVNGCESNAKRSKLENEEIAHNMAKISKKFDIKLVHISTDHLFNGEMPFATETTNPDPLNQYALSKLNAEKVVSKVNEEALIVRTNFYGWGPAHRTSFTDWILSELNNLKQINMFTDIYFSPINVLTLIDTIFELITHNSKGIYNVVGDERVSKHDFAVIVAKIFNLKEENIVKSKYENHNSEVKRPMDMSLSNEKLRLKLDRNIESLATGLSRLQESTHIKEDIKNLF